MIMTLSKSIAKGQRIKTTNGWRKVKNVTDSGAVVKEGTIAFGSTIFGWKSQ